MARKSKSAMRAGVWVLGLLPVIGLIVGGIFTSRMFRKRPAYLDLPRAVAERVDLQGSVVVGGGIDTAKKTVVECELETSLAQGGGGGGTSTIVELVEDGAMVKKGQMLARLDSSDYEEMVRQNEILLLQAQADEQKARLDLRTAEISLAEYRDGQLPQLRQYQEGQIKLYEAEIRRAKDRLDWAMKMVTNGYVSEGQALTDRVTLERAQVNLLNVKKELETLERATSVVQLERLQLAVETCRGELDYQSLRLSLREAQLKKAQKQVEACTIRAPHEGMMIYANTYNPNAQIQPGAIAYNHMNLGYLPDLTQTEVKVEFNESVYRKVRVGQLARIRVNGLSSRLLEGHIKSMDQIAMEPKPWWLSREIRNFSAVIAIHSPPPGVLPGMTAVVEVKGEIRPSVLVLPSTAVTFEKGHDVVYLVGPDGLERRIVAVESGDSQRVEICSGLHEGDQVILDPAKLDLTDTAVTDTTDVPVADQAHPSTGNTGVHSAP